MAQMSEIVEEKPYSIPEKEKDESVEKNETVKEKPYLILGLDIGIGSCGWAVLDMANKRIVDMGAHLWDPPQEPKTKVSKAVTRRTARSARRNIKRTADRKSACIKLFKEYGLIPEEADRNWIQTIKGDIQPLEARVEGLRRQLTDREFAQALYNICSRRGYIPHGEGTNPEDPEAGKVLKAISENTAKMNERGYETVGQLLFEQFSQGNASRNKGGDYSWCLTNEQLQDEVTVIFSKQKDFGNQKASDEFLERFIQCFTWQKPTSAHDEKVYSTVGYCTYFPDQKRAAKACLSYEMCTAYERLGHTVVVMPDREERKLPAKIKEEAIKTLFSPVSLKGNKNCTLKYSAIRRLMDLPANAYFKGIEKGKEDSTEVSNPKVWRKMRDILSAELMNRLANDRNLADSIGSALTYSSSEENLRVKLSDLGLTEEEINQIVKLPFSNKLFSDYGSRSLNALNLLIDAFEETDSINTLSEAEEASGLKACRMDRSNRGLRLPPYTVYDPTCNNPVVLRIMGRVRRVVNAVIATYGMPDEIHVELARELKIPKSEQAKITRLNNEKANARKTDLEHLSEDLQCDPDSISTTLLRKYELWKEQEGKDLYVDEPIEYQRMLTDDTYCQIDHILPYSRTCDDSQMNKILVLASSNQNKMERTPYEWLSAEGRWDSFEQRMEAIRATRNYPFKKIDRLLEENLTEKQEAFIRRNINDTRYATVAAAHYIDQYLQFPENDRSKHVCAVAGGATAALRNAWGLIKDRSAGDIHHAVDAVVIAACNESAVIAVARAHERKYYFPKEERGNLFKGSQPWTDFSRDVIARELITIPTRMVDHGGTGRLFMDKVYSYVGQEANGTKAILKREGKEFVRGNYVIREDGSVVLPDEMAFLRVWWNEETKHYQTEPVYYSDFVDMQNGRYVPRTPSANSQRCKWKPLSDSVLAGSPLVIRYGDVLEIKGERARYRSYGIDNLHLEMSELRNFAQEKSISSILSIREKDELRVIREDILGLCYKGQNNNEGQESEEQGELNS